MENVEMTSTFECLEPHFEALARAGYYKIVQKDVTPLKSKLHYHFRIAMWILVLTYNLQHVIKAIQVRHSTDEMVDTLFILLTTLSTLGKQIAFNIRSQRVERIIGVINGAIFAPTNQNHVDIMNREKILMARLLKLYHVLVVLCGSLWAMFPVLNRLLDEPVEFTGYFPFDTTSSIAFGLANAYMSITITIQAYGNVTMDCTIVAFFSQAKTQIQLLRYNLERLVCCSKINDKFIVEQNKLGKLESNYEILLQKRFVRCVEHVKQIVWMTKEVESIFREAMAVQFFVMAWVICMTVYKIVGLSILSGEFVSMAVYLNCMLAQLFIYCYFGTELKYESECVNQSIYESEWLTLSPRFRRQLLLMMQHCSRPIAPRIAYIVPMSLETYIMVLKNSYTLFTFLDRQ